MVDLSKTEDRPVERSSAGPLNIEVVEETGNGQKPATDLARSATLPTTREPASECWKGLRQSGCALQCTSVIPISMDCITW